MASQKGKQKKRSAIPYFWTRNSLVMSKLERGSLIRGENLPVTPPHNESLRYIKEPKDSLTPTWRMHPPNVVPFKYDF